MAQHVINKGIIMFKNIHLSQTYQALYRLVNHHKRNSIQIHGDKRDRFNTSVFKEQYKKIKISDYVSSGLIHAKCMHYQWMQRFSDLICFACCSEFWLFKKSPPDKSHGQPIYFLVQIYASSCRYLNCMPELVIFLVSSQDFKF